MTTEVLTPDIKNPEADKIKKAGVIIKNGGLVAFPTETVYGLGADALNPEAAMKIYAAKGRPSDNPLIVHIADLDALEYIAKDIPAVAYKLAEKFWPGPLTMIFNKKDTVPDRTSGGLKTVAVRMPDSPIALALIRESGGYIAAPSANTSGRPSPTCAAHVYEDMKGRIDMVIDGGDVEIGLESTIVDLTEDKPLILRPGFINQEMLDPILGHVEQDPALISPDSSIAPKAPGMKYRHYAPKAELTIINGVEDRVISYINSQCREASEKGLRTGIICVTEHEKDYGADVIKTIGSARYENEIAAHLYGILRDFDSEAVDIIYSESFYTPQLGKAIMNRLKKAAGGNIIEV